MLPFSNSNSCLTKQHRIKQRFAHCLSPQQTYEKIIELGKTLPSYPEEFKQNSNLVQGCQSVMYLHAELRERHIYFFAHSDALISSGLAALLLLAYNEETPEAILTCPPLFLNELGINASLSPGRSNGLASLFQTIQKHAMVFLPPKRIK